MNDKSSGNGLQFKFDGDGLELYRQAMKTRGNLSESEVESYVRVFTSALEADSSRALLFLTDPTLQDYSAWVKLLMLAVAMGHGDDQARRTAAELAPRFISTTDHMLFFTDSIARWSPTAAASVKPAAPPHVDAAKSAVAHMNIAAETAIKRPAPAPKAATSTKPAVAPPADAPGPRFQHGQFTAAMMDTLRASRKPLNPRQTVEGAMRLLGMEPSDKEMTGIVARARTILARPRDGLVAERRGPQVYYTYRP